VGDQERAVSLAERLAPHYSRFRVAERLLLTGHSHQAWPDVALEGQIEAFADAAELVDGKWERAFAKAEAVRDGFRRLLADPGRSDRPRREHPRTDRSLPLRPRPAGPAAAGDHRR
jgi:hypothetical protein